MKLLQSSLFVLTTLLCVTAHAQTWPDLGTVPAVEKTGSKDVAVVVAIEDYAFLPDVPGATRNAADWEAFLSDGLGVDRVLMLTNQQAVREDMLAFAEKGAAAVGEGGTLWFIFIGHGGPGAGGKDGLLIGADGQQNTKSMAARGLPQRDLLAALEKGRQSQTVVLIDACFSGRDSTGSALAKGAMPVIPVDELPSVDTSTVVMTAARSDEFAGDLPGANRPAFSYLVLGAMRGWADDGDGQVTAEEAVKFARREILGFSGRQQTPQIVGSNGIVLTRGAAEPQPTPTRVVPDANVGDQTPVDAHTSAAVVDPADVDGIADSPLYAYAGGGVGAVSDFGNIGVGGDFGLGVKLNGFARKSRNEWRLGIRFGIASAANSDAPSDGDMVEGGEVFSDDDPERANVLGWVVGPELGRAWRTESKPGVMGDNVFTLGIMPLYGKISKCSAWRLDISSGRQIACSVPKDASGVGGGISAAAQFGLIRVGAMVAFLTEFSVFASLSAGLTYDL